MPTSVGGRKLELAEGMPTPGESVTTPVSSYILRSALQCSIKTKHEASLRCAQYQPELAVTRNLHAQHCYAPRETFAKSSDSPQSSQRYSSSPNGTEAAL